MIAEGKKKKIKIKGIVLPVNWDQYGNPSEVSIATHNEEDYLVSKNLKGIELLNLVRNEVEVTGITKEVAGIKIISVIAIKEVKSDHFSKDNNLNHK